MEKPTPEAGSNGTRSDPLQERHRRRRTRPLLIFALLVFSAVFWFWPGTVSHQTSSPGRFGRGPLPLPNFWPIRFWWPDPSESSRPDPGNATASTSSGRPSNSIHVSGQQDSIRPVSPDPATWSATGSHPLAQTRIAVVDRTRVVSEVNGKIPSTGNDEGISEELDSAIHRLAGTGAFSLVFDSSFRHGAGSPFVFSGERVTDLTDEVISILLGRDGPGSDPDGGQGANPPPHRTVTKSL